MSRTPKNLADRCYHKGLADDQRNGDQGLALLSFCFFLILILQYLCALSDTQFCRQTVTRFFNVRFYAESEAGVGKDSQLGSNGLGEAQPVRKGDGRRDS